MTDALAGVRVVEIGTEITAPYCTKLLMDLGAEVHKVELPTGDPLRNWGPFCRGAADPNRSGLYEYLNVGKHCHTVDPTCNAGISAAYGLIATADVLVENLPPGPAHRREWGLEDDNLARINSSLIVVRISDFGQNGPLRERQTSPLTMQAAAGWVNSRESRPATGTGRAAVSRSTSRRVRGTRRADRPTHRRQVIPDRPVEVDVSMFEALLSTLPYPMLMAETPARASGCRPIQGCARCSASSVPPMAGSASTA